MKQTILHISKYYCPDVGGIETVAKYLAEGLTDYENVVVCFATDGKSRMDTINHIKVYRVAPLFSCLSQDVAFGYYRLLKKLIRQYSPAFIHLHCPNPFLYPMVLRLIPDTTKLIVHWHSDILSKGLMYNLVQPLEKQLVRRADLILCTSPNYITKSKAILQYKSKIKVLQNGIFTSDFYCREGDREKIEAIKEKYGHKKLVFFVGRHIPYKGIDFLIQAEKFIQADCYVLIAGSGPQTAALKRICHSDRIKFLGRLSESELKWYYYAADIFGFTSITKQEAFGVALAEAMYCKCVPVTFHLEGSGVNWVSVKGVTGEEVPLRNVQAYASAIDNILSHPDLQKQYAEAARRRVEEYFTCEIAVKTADEIYKSFSPTV